MKTLIATLALLSISISCFADITVDDLPYIEGTPLVERIDDIPVWSVLDYAEENGVVQWAWLDNAGYSAYVVYPSEQDTLLPDDATIPASDHMLTLRFVGEDQEYTFSRYGGETVLSGDEITFGYTAPDKAHLLGSDFPHGDLFLKAENIQIGAFFGGRFRNVTIFAQDELIMDEPDAGGGLSGNSGGGSAVCSGSVVTISSDPTLLEPGSTCLIGGIVSSPITLPDLSPGVVLTPCRFPEPHEYTGEKKVLCGENWVELSDEAWADLTANSDLQPVAEVPQEQNPPSKKKKSKGGSIPFSILHLLLLVLIFQQTSNRRPLL